MPSKPKDTKADKPAEKPPRRGILGLRGAKKDLGGRQAQLDKAEREAMGYAKGGLVKKGKRGKC
jgi:hypothetical protein